MSRVKGGWLRKRMAGVKTIEITNKRNNKEGMDWRRFENDSRVWGGNVYTLKVASVPDTIVRKEDQD